MPKGKYYRESQTHAGRKQMVLDEGQRWCLRGAEFVFGLATQMPGDDSCKTIWTHMMPWDGALGQGEGVEIMLHLAQHNL